MMKRVFNIILVMVASALLFACGGEKLELKVTARLDGQPVASAKVTVDNEEQGQTGADGTFSRTIKKKPGADVEVAVVAKELPGYRIKPWKGSFLMKLPKSGSIDTYALAAELEATRFITIKATEKGAPVQDAVVLVAGADAGKTDAQGLFVYEYKDQPTAGLDLSVTKSGYAAWRKTGPVAPGFTLEAALSKRVIVTVSAFMEEYGQTSGIPGVSVSINKKTAGKTDAKGVFTYTYDGEPGKKAQLSLSAPGSIPETWKTTITLEGEVAIERYFYPTTPKRIRTGIYRFSGNTPNVDLREVVAQTETALAAQLFKNACFRETPSQALQTDIKRARLNIDKIIVKGWRETTLRKTVDMIVLGSVAKDEKGYLIETKFYTSGGKLILSQLARAKSSGDINSAAREIAAAVLERFAFEGGFQKRESGDVRVCVRSDGTHFDTRAFCVSCGNANH